MNSVGSNEMLLVSLGEWFATWWWVIPSVLGLLILKTSRCQATASPEAEIPLGLFGKNGRMVGTASV